MPRKATIATQDIDRAIGRNVRIFRESKDITQSELAKKLGVTFQQVQKYEKGTNRIGSGRLLQIASFMGRPITDFFAGAEGGPDVGKVDASVLSLMAEPHSVRLVQAFSGIKDRNLRRAVVSLVERLATNRGR